MDWWNELTELQQFFASVAIPATLVMIFQFILLLFGFSQGDGADGANADVDINLHEGDTNSIFDGNTHDGFEENFHDSFEVNSHDEADHHMSEGQDTVDALRLFTLRSIIAFFSIGGWMGVAAVSWNVPTIMVFLLAFFAGWVALYFVACSIRAALRMQQSGNIILENAVGKIGEVYIPIPPSKSGFGKVNVIVQDRLSEFDAITHSDRELKTGENITVIGIASEGVLLVVPKSKPPEGIMIEKEF